MTDTQTDPRAQLAEIEERILDGDVTVTPTMLAKARDAANLAELHVLAADRAAERDRAAAGERRRRRARNDIAAAAVALDAARSSYGAAVDALRTLVVQRSAYERAHQIARAAATGAEMNEEMVLPEPRLVDVYVTRALADARGNYVTTGDTGLQEMPAPRYVAHELVPAAMSARINAELAASYAARWLPTADEIDDEEPDGDERAGTELGGLTSSVSGPVPAGVESF